MLDIPEQIFVGIVIGLVLGSSPFTADTVRGGRAVRTQRIILKPPTLWDLAAT